MSSSRFQKHLLASSIAVVLGTAVTLPVLAQDSEQADKKAKEQKVEVIQVSGIRGSMKANINAKRFSNSVVDVITAEDIGKFPDKNVAESLSRITGVAISREFGEGEKVTIRGSGPTKNRTLLNGQNVATADWFILDQPSRGFNFTLLPSSLVSRLDVYKTPQADVDEGSIGGTVVLRTRKPLELEANSFNMSIQNQYSQTSGKHDPQIDAMYSWRNDAQTFGALISATKQKRQVQREGMEVLGWQTYENGEIRPRDIGIPIFRQERERDTIFASFQYAPNDSFDVTLNYLDSSMDANNHNVNLLIRPQNNFNPNVEDGDEVLDQVWDGNVLVAGRVEDGAFEWDFINRESSTETQSVDLDLNYSTDTFSFHAQVGRTEAKGGTYNETSWSFIPNVTAGYDFDLSGSTPVMNIGVDPTDGTKWKQNWTWGGNKPTTDEETFAQFDFDLPVEWGVVEQVNFGVKYRDHDRTQNRQAYSWHGPGTSSNPDSAYMWDIFEQCPTLADCNQSDGVHVISGDILGGNVNTQLDGNYDAFMELGFGGNADYAVSDVLGEIWAMNEQITAAYVSADFSGENYRGNFGVRVVQTKQTASSYYFSSDSWGFHTVDREWLTPSVLEWITDERKYTDVLPSFNLAYDLSDDQVLRFGVAKVMARANFSDLAPVKTTGDLNGANPTGTSGNPDLDPERVTQFDVAYEYYFNESSLFAVTYFYKDIESYKDIQQTTEQFFNDQSEQWVDVTITKPVNGKGGSTHGIEVGYQQTFNEFGLAVNYTYTDATADEGLAQAENKRYNSVDGASEHMFNATGFYETESFQARLMYNYRTEWYKGVNWTGANLWNDDYGQWDFSSSYKVTDNLDVVFEVVNLTDEETVEYDHTKIRGMSTYQNGRRYVLGLNMSF